MYRQEIEAAKAHFARILEAQLQRIEGMKQNESFIDYQKLDKIVIGIVGGDGIGPYIAAQAERVLAALLADQINAGRIELRTIEGLTIENRIAKMQAIPDEVMGSCASAMLS